MEIRPSFIYESIIMFLYTHLHLLTLSVVFDSQIQSQILISLWPLQRSLGWDLERGVPVNSLPYASSVPLKGWNCRLGCRDLVGRNFSQFTHLKRIIGAKALSIQDRENERAPYQLLLNKKNTVRISRPQTDRTRRLARDRISGIERQNQPN